MNLKIIGTLIGFILFIFGLLSLILSVAGLQFSYLTFLDGPSKTFGLLARLAMIFLGIIVIAASRTDWAAERAELEEAE